MKWKIITESGRDGYFGYGDTKEQAIKDACPYYPMMGAVIDAVPVAYDYHEIDTTGD